MRKQEKERKENKPVPENKNHKKNKDQEWVEQVVVYTTGQPGFQSTFYNRLINQCLSLSICSPAVGIQTGYRFSPGWYCGSVAVK